MHMTITKEKLLKNFRESLPAWRSQSTLYRYPQLISHFIDFVGVKSTYDRTDAMKFLNHIVTSGMSNNYARWAYYILRNFYKSLGITFPLTARELPPLPGPEGLNAPVFSPDYVEKLITTVRKKGNPAMKAYLALSTTFGFRRVELARISDSAISNSLIRVQSVKGGQLREHIIPDEIALYLAGFKFKKVSDQTLTNIFHRMQGLSGLPQEEGEGWHGIRRSLVTELLGAGVPIHIVYSFIGWKLSSRLGIIGTYARPEPTMRDELVYEHHPWLRSWS